MRIKLLLAAAVFCAAASTVQAASPEHYPSPLDPGFLPNGTLVKTPGESHVYYLYNGTKSWILPDILNRWLNENHYFKHNLIIILDPADIARYQPSPPVNPVYVGKVLQDPSGAQFFIDDQFRKRPLFDSVRGALRLPARNLYPTSEQHLNEFQDGPPLSANSYPGGFVLYSGPYHGGDIWQMREHANGQVYKHLYASDYLYESYYNPDETHRAPAVPAIFNLHPQGANIERYPDGWIVGLDDNIYVVSEGSLRHITTPALFNAMGYGPQHITSVYPHFLRRYPVGVPISAFKHLDFSPAPAPPSFQIPPGWFSVTNWLE